MLDKALTVGRRKAELHEIGVSQIAQHPDLDVLLEEAVEPVGKTCGFQPFAQPVAILAHGRGWTMIGALPPFVPPSLPAAVGHRV